LTIWGFPQSHPTIIKSVRGFPQRHPTGIRKLWGNPQLDFTKIEVFLKIECLKFSFGIGEFSF
jgi:hypothetical protein